MNRVFTGRTGSLLAVVLLIMMGISASPFSLGTDPDEKSIPVRSDQPAALNPSASLIKKIDDVSIRTMTESSHNRHLIEHGSWLFYVFNWFNGTRTTLSMYASYDNGENWTSKLDVWNSTYFDDVFSKELLVWKGNIYLIWCGYRVGYTGSAAYMKKAPLDSWQGLQSATTVTIRSNYGHSFGLDTDENYIYMSMVISSSWQSYFYRYDGSSWSSGYMIASTGRGSNAEIEVVKTGSTSKILFFYDRPNYGSGYVNMVTSTDGGATWTTNTTVMDKSGSYQELQSMDINGTILLFACQSDDDKLDMVISRDNGTTWSNEKTLVSQRGGSAYLFGKYGYSVGLKDGGRTVMLAYEGSSERIDLVYSNDWGSNWIPESKEINIHSPNSFNPMFSLDGRYHAYQVVNGSRYNIEIVNLDELFLDDSTPRNLSIRKGYLYLNLTWKPPKSGIFSQYGFNGYRLYRGTKPDEMSLYKVLGNVTMFNDSILDFTPMRYYYAVTSVFSRIGESGFSNIVSGMPAIPKPPTNLTKEEGDLYVKISWDPIDPQVMMLYPVEYYTVFRGCYPDSLLPIARVVQGEAYNDTDIDPYPSYYHYRVSYSLMGAGEGELSAQIRAKPNTLSDPPEGVVFNEISGGVNVSWSPPGDTGNLPISYYTAYGGPHPDEMTEIDRIYPDVMVVSWLDLTPGDRYFFKVTASNRLGPSKPSEVLMVDYKGTPSRPEDLMALGGFGCIDLSWSGPRVTWDLPISAYHIYRGTSPYSTRLYKTMSGGSTSFRDIVEMGIMYHYQVSAVNSFGEGQKAEPVSAKASWIPGKVTDVSLKVGNGTIRIYWGPVENDGGTPVTHYRVYRSLDNTTPGQGWDVPGGLMLYNDRGLKNGRTYCYWISAINLNGEGALSHPVEGTPGTYPYAVKEISIRPLLYGVSIQWAHPDPGGREILSFNIYRGFGRSSLHLLTSLSASSPEDPSFLDEGLLYGSTYFYSVTSVNHFGESPFSPVVSTAPFGAPSPPCIIEAYGKLKEMTVSWTASPDTGGLPLTANKVYYRNMGAVEWETVETDPEQLYLRIFGIGPGSEIEVRLSAVNTKTEGPPSDPWRVLVGDVPATISDLSAEPMDSGCTISWEAPLNNGYPILGYVLYMVDERGHLVLMDRMQGDVKSCVVSGLLNGVNYGFRVSSMNVLGESQLSNRVQVVPGTHPGAPTGVEIMGEGDGFIEISWNPPESDGGYPIIEYRIYRTDVESSSILIATRSAGEYDLRDDDVTNGKGYDYYITAVNGFGESEKSPVIHGSPLWTPSAPRDLELSSSTDIVVMEWLPPIDDGGAPIEGYIVYKGRTQGDLDVWRYLKPGTTSINDRSVEHGQYIYRIHAYNSRGIGEGMEGEIEVPPRIPTAVMLGVVVFLVPLVVLGAILLLSYMIRKREISREQKGKVEEERKNTIPPPGLPPSVSGPPILPGAGGSLTGLPSGPMPGPYYRPIPQPLQGSTLSEPEKVLPPAPPEIETVSEPVQHPEPEPVDPPSNEDIVINEPTITETPDPGEESFLEPPAPEGQTIFHEDHDHLWSPQMVEHRSVQETENALQMLKELNDLKKTGALTEEEYDISKRRLLRRI